MKPLISIILPTYNGACFIEHAIGSVLKQSYSDWELLIICDGSHDGTDGIVQAFSDPRIRYIEHRVNLGIQKTLNRGISESKGVYIARIDDDDVWVDSEKLQNQIEYLENNKEYVLLGTDALVVDTEGLVLSKHSMPKTDKEIRDRILSKNCFLHSTVLMRKESLVGGYSEQAEALHAEDYDLWLRLGTRGKFANLPMVSTYLTVHTGSVTSKHRVLQSWHSMRTAYKYKAHYPHISKGVVIGGLRVLFFLLLRVIPVPQRLVLRIQRLYKAI